MYKILLSLLLLILTFACNKAAQKQASDSPTVKAKNTPAEIVIYNGRKAQYVQPLCDLFSEKTGIKVTVKSGKTAELAELILKEGQASSADVFFAQDSANLNILSEAELLDHLPRDILKRVDSRRYSSPREDWVGTTGRARVLVYNPAIIKQDELPRSILQLTDSKWKSKLGWAVENASFQAHVAVMLKVIGKEKTLAWLKGMKANEIHNYPKNTPIVEAVAAGEIAAGLVNHYYLHKVRLKNAAALKIRNHYFDGGDVGMFVGLSGIALVKSSKNKEAALNFIRFMLSEEAQDYFKESNFEYPLALGVKTAKILKPLDEINPVRVDLSDLGDLKETKKILKASQSL
ncbi:MAG: iron ABC transporter substrate-binding protein [Lentisphaeraceae bacterium]|nr:iron ABC transporter substrate-binding protein [Lentisphaeraceae bacterium]